MTCIDRINMTQVARINPFNRFEADCAFGEKKFPCLFHRIPPDVGITERTLRLNPNLRREKKLRADTLVTAVSPLHLKRLERSNNRFATMVEFTELRNSRPYKHIYDMVGTDFPIHPEYLYVLNVILNFFDVEYFDIVETFKQSETKSYVKRMQDFLNFTTKPIAECASVIFFVLHVEYQWNPYVMQHVFGDIRKEAIRHSIGRFLRDYDRSDVFREAYKEIHHRLIMLEKL